MAVFPDPFKAATRLVVLSPHLDDAVLSCGAMLAAARDAAADATVLTVFNGRPDGPLSAEARRFHTECGHGDNAMALREAEDDLALQTLGVRTTRLGLPEALYRRDDRGQPRYAHPGAIFRSSHDTEASLIDRLASEFSRLTAITSADLLLAPLGIGGHIDHKVVAAAANHLSLATLWYEDVPYVIYDHCREWRRDLEPADPTIRVATHTQWRTKLDAISRYASQHAILWPDPSNWRSFVTSYGHSVGNGAPAERFWGRHS